jgi:transcriptional regulator with XRE-family HTH domain
VVAHRAGLTVSAHTRIERGDANPTWSTVTQIAQALGILIGRVRAPRLRGFHSRIGGESL